VRQAPHLYAYKSCTNSTKSLNLQSSRSFLNKEMVSAVSKQLRSSSYFNYNRSSISESFEIIDRIQSAPVVLLTAEHASSNLPNHYKWPEKDDRLFGTHWQYDPGSDDLTREMLSAGCGNVAILAHFSRLLIDLNRPLSSDTLFRTEADNQPVQLNIPLPQQEKQNRIKRYYEPYHHALKRLVQQVVPQFILSIHSFSPVYEGSPRSMEIGVLYHRDINKKFAEYINSELCSRGYKSVINGPWSGLQGFMYSSANASTKVLPFDLVEIPAIMIECRQDLIVQTEWRAKFIDHIKHIFGIDYQTGKINAIDVCY